jgi:hypothetical protein
LSVEHVAQLENEMKNETLVALQQHTNALGMADNAGVNIDWKAEYIGLYNQVVQDAAAQAAAVKPPAKRRRKSKPRGK